MQKNSRQNAKLRYNLDAMLRGLREQYPEIGHIPSESLTQEKIGEVFAKRKKKARLASYEDSTKD